MEICANETIKEKDEIELLKRALNSKNKKIHRLRKLVKSLMRKIGDDNTSLHTIRSAREFENSDEVIYDVSIFIISVI